MADLADLVILAGQMILENGGETRRVEETMMHMSFAGGAKAVDVVATPPGIFCTITTEQGTFTRVARIYKRGLNLAKVLEVNRISRELSEGTLSVEAAYQELQKLDAMPRRYATWIHTLAAASASSAFTYLLGAHVGSVFVAGLTGLMVMITVDALQDRGVLHFVAVAFGGVVAAVTNLTAKIIFPSLEFDLAVVGSIMVLVPGVAITNSMRDALSEDLVSAAVRGIEALGVASSIAVGVGAVLALYIALGGQVF